MTIGKRFLTAGELAEWSETGLESFWSPVFELSETESSVDLIVDLPGCKAGDIQIALLPRLIILRQNVRLLASRSFKDWLRTFLGSGKLFRRFELPALIDVNQVKAELKMGVLTVTARKQSRTEQPASHVPDRPRAFAA